MALPWAARRGTPREVTDEPGPRRPGQPGELRRNALGFTEVVITGLSQIAPAFGVMFTAAVIAANVGPAVPSVYLLALVGILATGITLAQFSRIWPSSGSFVTYISRADPAPFVTASNHFISPLAGVVTWLFLTSVTDSYLGANTALARIVFSGAREGLWDRRLATVHPRFRTPWVAVLAWGAAAIQDRLGVTATGYRSPCWELTPETMEMLAGHGFGYDSSCMGDDRPYYEVHGDSRILEFPIHWSLDDWPYLAWHPGGNELLTTPSDLIEAWLAEFDSAVAERRHITFTMHPEVIGRGARMAALATLITRMRERASIWFARHRDLARLLSHG